MKIVLDAFGGDYAPSEIIKGAVMALNCEKDISLIICGKEEAIKQELNKLGWDGQRAEIIDAPEVITNDDTPTEAIRTKKNSSLIVALNTLKEREDAVGRLWEAPAPCLPAAYLFSQDKGVKPSGRGAELPTVTTETWRLSTAAPTWTAKRQTLSTLPNMGSAYMKYCLQHRNPAWRCFQNG